ncbi:MAG: Holliday junction branch migration protein RuvA [Planctomycetota bacterium]
MIVRLSGMVAEVHDGYTIIERDGIGYEVLVCGYALGELAACKGRQTMLYTMEYYEGSSAGGNLIPRLIGFLHPEDRIFFERFITVKGMGARKALKALNTPIGRIAAAIEAADSGYLAGLPGIGKRAAEKIIAELKGKMGDFAIGVPQDADTSVPAGHAWPEQLRDALEVMIALGERRADAERWLERAQQLHPGQHGPDEWVRLAYRVKTGSEG